MTTRMQIITQKNCLKFAVTIAIFIFGFYSDAHAQTAGNWISANPTPNAGPDKNPMKGFNSGWWNPNDDHATVGYQTLEWGKLEPTDDDFQFGEGEYLEQVLGRPGSAGRHVIVQMVADWNGYQPIENNYLGPDWLIDDVGVEIKTGHVDNDPNKPLVQATDYNDPNFISEAVEAITALTNHLKDDPRTFVIQTGVLGWWGEWHTFGFNAGQPGQIAKETILQAYLNGIGPDGLTQVRYPDEPINVPQNRMGYTNGSVVPSTHGYEFGIEIEANELWKNGPVGGETPPLDGVTDDQLHRFFETDEGAMMLAQGHYSNMLPPEDYKIAERLEGWTDETHFMTMHRMMGYNFQVEEVRHLNELDEMGQLQVEVDLGNVGIAPIYKDWDVQLAFLDAGGAIIGSAIDIDLDLRELNPGDSTTITAAIGEGLEVGSDYQLALRLLQPDSDDPKQTSEQLEWEKLNARNTYIVLANDVEVIDGYWNRNIELQGGWNVLDTLSPIISIPGDYNGNGVVDTADYTVWVNSYGTLDGAADGNGDGFVDAADYTYWRDAYAASASSVSATAVPEPITLTMLISMLLAMVIFDNGRSPLPSYLIPFKH